MIREINFERQANFVLQVNQVLLLCLMSVFVQFSKI